MLNAASKEILEEITREFDKKLVIPTKKSPVQWMLMPVGFVGAGKTTVVKPLSEHFGLVRVSNDEIRKMLKERGYSYDGCRDIAYSIVQKYLNMGYSLAIDANNGGINGVNFDKKTAEEFPHVMKIYIHINPPEEFIINKLRNFNHTWLYRDGEHAVESFLKHKKDFRASNLPFVYTFDTSKDNVPAQIQEATIEIEKAVNI